MLIFYIYLRYKIKEKESDFFDWKKSYVTHRTFWIVRCTRVLSHWLNEIELLYFCSQPIYSLIGTGVFFFSFFTSSLGFGFVFKSIGAVSLYFTLPLIHCFSIFQYPFDNLSLRPYWCSRYIKRIFVSRKCKYFWASNTDSIAYYFPLSV